METPLKNDDGTGQGPKVVKPNSIQLALSLCDDPVVKPPKITGQCAQVLNLIRQFQPVLSLELTANHAIPETAARVHDLRAAGWNVLTTIHPTVIFRGVERRNVASYSLGAPEWVPPRQSGRIDASLAACVVLLVVVVVLSVIRG